MGQRLVITVKKDKKVIAGIYYHWSAYSVSALVEARDLLDYILDEENDIGDLKLELIRYVESRGGCIRGGYGSEEWEAITKMYPNEEFNDDGSRNDGIIALTPEGIEGLEYWSEGDIVLDLDKGVLYNEVYYQTTLKELRENEGEVLKLKDIPEMDISIEQMNFDDIHNVIHELEEDSNLYMFRKGRKIYQLIA